jgi:ubiquinone/menaquinone biosynthesis C-methylase UbiE
MARLKEDIRTTPKHGLNYIQGNDGRPLRFKPWLGDAFSPLYDAIMRRSIFPKKFGSSMDVHHEILARALAEVQGRLVLEIGTGSGSAVRFLSNSNRYVGTDVSAGLLRQAVYGFRDAGFENPEFYVASGDALPFADGAFDACLCILTLNFIGRTETALDEVSRVLAPDGLFVCSVPVPERNSLRSTIRGELTSERDLKRMCEERRFRYESIPDQNGALLYFTAEKIR